MTHFYRAALCSVVLLSSTFGQGVQTEWTRKFPTSHSCGFSPIGTVDEKDNLWLVCEGLASRQSLGSLLQVEHTGRLLSEQELRLALPESAKGEVTNIALASSKTGRIGVLMSLTRWEGRDADFEGAYFAVIKDNRLGEPTRVSAPGPQFLDFEVTKLAHLRPVAKPPVR